MKNRETLNVGSGLAIGIGIGTAVGVAIDNIGAGIGMGVAIGAAIGLTLGKENAGAESSLSPEASRQILFILLALGIFAGLGIIGYLLLK